MRSTRSHRRARLAALTSAVLTFAGFQLLAAPASQAAPSTGLVISEVYGAGGNAGASFTNDFIELYNPTGSPISVAGMSVQYRSGNGTTPTLTNLTGSVPAGGHYLVQEGTGGAVGAALPTPDATGAIAMSGTTGVVILASNTTGVTAQGDFANAGNPANVIDTVGYGTAATTFETTNTGTNLSATTSAQRVVAGTDTDANNADFSEALPTPQSLAPLPLSLTNPGTQNSVEDAAIPTLNVSASGGVTPYTFGATGLPSGILINTSSGAITGTPDTAGTYNVQVTVTDSAAPTAGTDTESFTWFVNTAGVVTPIADLQGATGTSPVAGAVRTTQGVVTALYPAGGFNGFYIQTPGADATPGASDAIFVFGPSFDESTLAIGDSVEVTGTVSEFTTSGPNTLTEITATTVTDIASLGTVVAKTTIPDSDCALGSCPTLAASDTAKEAVEGEVFQPSGNYTVTDAFDGSATNPTGSNSSSFFGEIGLAANSTIPLVSPTEVIDAQSTAAIQEKTRFNNLHRVVLDDGSSLTFWNTTNTAGAQDDPLPWWTQAHQIRVGAAVTFPQPVILENRFGWKVQPTTTVTGVPTAQQPQFEQDRPATPEDVGGDLKLATFNVLNYFTTLGVDYDAGPGTCTSFVDRDGNPIAVNSCDGDGPRGAWNAASFQRQQDKIVHAINTLDADIVSLEEIENSRKVDDIPNRDEAVGALVDALNADAGSTRWAFVPSPAEADLPPEAEEDVIRTAFIYNPDTVDLVGTSQILTGVPAFANAREPLAQAFKAAGGDDADGFAVVVNHFKSKGSGADDGTGQGLANPDRIAQAQALNTFANSFAAARGVDAAFLTGDFNAYSEEDPVQVLTDDPTTPWTNLESTDDPQEESYSFEGSSGSLDHVFANAAADDLVTGVDIWEINANETVFNQYSRYNYVGTLLYNDGPFSASDHNPEIVGIDVPDVEPATRDIQILGTNDFHGRLQRDGAGPTAGAAVLAGAVKQLRAANPDTVFAAAGDLIGASTFESFIAKDKPTIDALNEAGLEVSAAGNHEFDQGYDDLVNRVMAPYDADDNPFGGANWEYISANLRLDDDSHALAPTWTKDIGSVKVGFVGAVTEHLPELVSPAGISEITVTDIVTEVNAAADDLEADGADVIVLLVHEGAAGTDCATMDDDPTSDFGSIITGVDDNIDAIVSGHTHLAYNCSFSVPGWVADTRPVTERPVVSAGQYGMALNQLVFTVDTATGEVQAKTQALLNLQSCTSNCTPPATPVWTPNFPADSATAAIVAAAVANAAVLGAQPLGNLGGPFFRGKLADGTTDNRGAESTLGNLVAEVQKWATRAPESGEAEIAFMNPGGLRADMTGTGTGPFPRTLTYQQAAVVQPFANTLVNMDLTGAQIKTVLEQQWQAAGASRPFLKLGISKGFTYTFDDTKPQGSRITGMWLDGIPIAPAATFSVTVNSFLAAGGDGFAELNNGAGKQDTGKTDLQGMVDYMAAFGSGADQVTPDYKQNGVGISFPAGAPASYEPGGHVLFNVSSWSMTNLLDTKDTDVVVKAGATTLGTFPLDNAPQAALPGFDIVGKASVDVVVPNDATTSLTLTLTGATTGTTSTVTVPISQAGTTVAAPDVSVVYGQAAPVAVTVTGGATTPTGVVELFDGTTSLGSATLDAAGKATITVPAKTFPAGTKTLTVEYAGDATHDESETTLTLTTTKAASTVAAGDVSVEYGLSATVTVNVGAPAGVTPTGTVTVRNGGTTLGTGTVSGGVATVTLPAGSLPVGSATLTAAYGGDANVAAGTDSFTVTVSKAGSTTKAKVKPNHPKRGHKVKLKVGVDGDNGVEATGKVKVTVDGETVTKTLKNGKLTLNLGPFGKGTYKVKVVYLGSDTLEDSKDKVTFTVS